MACVKKQIHATTVISVRVWGLGFRIWVQGLGLRKHDCYYLGVGLLQYLLSEHFCSHGNQNKRHVHI